MSVFTNKSCKGFLVRGQKRIYVTWKKTLSIIQNEILLLLVESHSHFMCGNLLDLGCGSKPYELIYGERVNQSIGTDVPSSPHRLDIDSYAHGECLPFKNGIFDTILCTEVLEHALDIDKVASEMRRVLKDTGIVIMSVPFIYPVHEPPFDFLRFTAFGVRNLLERHGFELISLRAKGGFITAFVCILQYGIIRAFHQVLRKIKLEYLMERSVFRLMFVIHQLMYWYVFRFFFGKTLRKCTTHVSKYEILMSLGYFCVARKKGDGYTR